MLPVVAVTPVPPADPWNNVAAVNKELFVEVPIVPPAPKAPFAVVLTVLPPAPLPPLAPVLLPALLSVIPPLIYEEYNAATSVAGIATP